MPSPGVTTIRDLVSRLDIVTAGVDRFEVGPAIFARLPWTPDSDAVVLHEDAVEPGDARGFRLVLEATIASEVIRVWSAWRDGRRPDPDEAAAAVIYYAENDAYLPVTDGGGGPMPPTVSDPQEDLRSLLPLLERPRVESALDDAAARRLVAFGLTAWSDWWASKALDWVDQGVWDDAVAEALGRAAQDQTYSQATRHRAWRYVKGRR